MRKLSLRACKAMVVFGKAVTGLASIASCLVFNDAMAKDFPSQPVKIVVPWTPGGNVDSVARLIAAQLSKRLSQPVVVENKSGASGIIGATYVAQSKPDGYTLVIANPETHTLNVLTQKKLPYDPLEDFATIGAIGRMSGVLVARVGLGAKTLSEVISLAKKEPGSLKFGSWGIGSVPHLTMEMFMSKTGTEMLHVPYRGGPEAYNALIAGEVDIARFPAYMAKPLADAGKLVLLASLDPVRNPQISHVPTAIEAGYVISTESALGLLAPAGTPAPVISRLELELSDLLRRDDVKSSLESLGISVSYKSAAAYRHYLKSELESWAAVIAQTGLSVK